MASFRPVDLVYSKASGRPHLYTVYAVTSGPLQQRNIDAQEMETLEWLKDKRRL